MLAAATYCNSLAVNIASAILNIESLQFSQVFDHILISYTTGELHHDLCEYGILLILLICLIFGTHLFVALKVGNDVVTTLLSAYTELIEFIVKIYRSYRIGTLLILSSFY